MQLRMAALWVAETENYLSHAADPYDVKFTTNWFLT